MRGLLKDFGIFARHRLANQQSFLFEKLHIDSFAKIDDSIYTIMSTYKYDKWEFALSIDFDADVLNEFMDQMDHQMVETVEKFLSKGDRVELRQEIEINVRAKPGTKILQNKDETYIPFKGLSIRIWKPGRL